MLRIFYALYQNDKYNEKIIQEHLRTPTLVPDSKFALSKTSRNDENKAHHLIQSFLPGGVDFDTAHQIGMDLADYFRKHESELILYDGTKETVVRQMECGLDKLNQYLNPEQDTVASQKYRPKPSR